MADTTLYQTNDLFDGTFAVDLPHTFKNIRDKSHVPDNQEVFTDFSGDGHLVFEITEPPQVPDTEVAKYYFEDLAECNESLESSITISSTFPNDHMPNIEYCPCFTKYSPTIPKYYLEGEQKVIPDKVPTKPPEDVHIFIAILRLKQVDSDVMISLSVPHKGESSEMYLAKVQNYAIMFKRTLGSFKIVSLEVFASV